MTTPNTVFIPGHGQLGTREDLVALRDAISTIHDRVVKMVADGMTVEQIGKRVPRRIRCAFSIETVVDPPDFYNANLEGSTRRCTTGCSRRRRRTWHSADTVLNRSDPARAQSQEFVRSLCDVRAFTSTELSPRGKSSETPCKRLKTIAGPRQVSNLRPPAYAGSSPSRSRSSLARVLPQ